MNSEAVSRQDGRLTILLVARVLVTSVLFTGLLFAIDKSDGFTIHFLQALVSIAFLSSALGGLALRKGEMRRALVDFQLIIDVLLALGFIYVTGASASPLVLLFGTSIVASALVSKARVVVTVLLLSTGLFVALCVGIYLSVIPPPPDQAAAIYRLDAASLVFNLASNAFGLSLVGALAFVLRHRLGESGKSLAKVESLRDAIVGSLTSGLAVVDSEGCFVFLNDAGKAILFDESDAVDVPSSRVEAKLFLPLGDMAKKRAEGVGTRQSGERFPVGFTSNELATGDGQLVLFSDLTEVRALEVAAERSERLASLGRVASSLAHEIRNPLGSISGSVQLVRDGATLDPEDAELLDLVLSETERLNALVSQMLDVAKPKALAKERVELRELCEGVLSMAANDERFAAADVELVGHGSAHVDPMRTRQVLWNVIKNAFEAKKPDKKAQLVITIEEQKRSVEIRVDDAGVGIASDMSERLFDLFASGGPRGIGLGLTIVRQVMDQHGGEVSASESPMGGARITLSFPRMKADVGLDVGAIIDENGA